MPRFFLSPELLRSAAAQSAPVEIGGENARHISLSLRMKTGDRLLLCDGEGMEYDAAITAITSQAVTVQIDREYPSRSESPVASVLYQAIVKGDKMDTVIQKAVELGVSEIVPVETLRCVAKISPEAAEKKILRWQKIADEAAGQSGRGVLPKVHWPMNFSDAAKRATQTVWDESRVALICYEGEENQTLKTLLPPAPPKQVSFFIGPEGGFEPTEIELAARLGILPAGLGRRILRTETASSFVLSSLCYVYEI